MVIISLAAAKRLVSQEITVTMGWDTDVSTTYICFMSIFEKCWLNGYYITNSCQDIGEQKKYSNHRLGY